MSNIPAPDALFAVMIRGLTDEGVAMCATKLRLTPEAVVKVSDVMVMFFILP
ncbi:MAG: hypothetical protein PHP98_11600 [Kiritimatiellae bacterium]|nr:hypothetical protein [Kiritimatiellia bacterium]